MNELEKRQEEVVRKEKGADQRREHLYLPTPLKLIHRNAPLAPIENVGGNVRLQGAYAETTAALSAAAA